MISKRTVVSQLMRMLGDSYWEATLEERLHRLKAVVPVKSSRNDFIYEGGVAE